MNAWGLSDAVKFRRPPHNTDRRVTRSPHRALLAGLHLMIAEPEFGFRARGCRAVGESFLRRLDRRLRNRADCDQGRLTHRTAVYGPVCTVVWEGEAVRPTPIPILANEPDCPPETSSWDRRCVFGQEAWRTDRKGGHKRFPAKKRRVSDSEAAALGVILNGKKARCQPSIS